MANMKDSDSESQQSNDYMKGYAKAYAEALRSTSRISISDKNGDEEKTSEQQMLGVLVDKAVLAESDGKIPQFNCIKAHVDAVFTTLENCVERFDAMNADKRYELKNLVLVLDRNGKYDSTKMNQLLERLKGPTLLATIPEDVALLSIMAAQRGANQKMCFYDARANTGIKYVLEGMTAYALVQRIQEAKADEDQGLRIQNPTRRGRGRGRGGRGNGRGRGWSNRSRGNNNGGGNNRQKRSRDYDDEVA